MNILLNGEQKQVPDSITVAGLLEFLKIQHQRVAVELNMEIVKKDQYSQSPLKEGDRLEVVSFMAGGCLEREPFGTGCVSMTATRLPWSKKE
jgi:thiamine biosynthesis protein ThiS